MELRDIKGIGPKTEQLMNKVGIFTPEDLLRYYPVGYDEYAESVPIGNVTIGAKCTVEGTIARPVAMRRGRKVTIVTTEISDPTGKIQLIWFNAPFIAGMLKRGSVWMFRGIVSERNGRTVMDHPEILTPAKYEEMRGKLVPVYGLTKGLSRNMIAKSVRTLLDHPDGLVREYLPESLTHLMNLMDEEAAVRAIHFPDTKEEFGEARERLVFDELFLFVLGVRMLKAEEKEYENEWPMEKVWDTEELIAGLPYRLTKAQTRTWREIERDMTSASLMSRLVQGDVGSGKTVIAFLAMTLCGANGYQSAMMAPTEVLAKQHFEKLTELIKSGNIADLRPVLLTGSLKTRERREALEGIRDGRYNAVIGTHALFQDAVEYRNLALVITDEQHRFGVKQREAMMMKNARPHTLVMSATPIPRTLGIIFYGDLDISVIDEMPARRLPIKNAVVDLTWRERALRFIGKQLAEGRQVYIICPMIEPDEELGLSNVTEETAAIKKAFPDSSVGMLHGRMRNDEKNRVMERFLAGDIQVLVSTTVVEVGVDVPNATVMMIENAERFGLSQLHQLRGRVGRGAYQSYCIFMAGQKSEAIEKRLGILRESDDGFEIAEKDFELRGPGDLMGIRQSGDAMFRLADLTRDGEILKAAGETAAAVCADDPALIDEKNLLLREEMTRYMQSNEQKIVL